VVHRDDKVLICRRPENKLYGGLWEFPGGKLEPGETLTACLRRELREELDIEVVPGVFLASFDHTFTHFSVTVHAFDCPVGAIEPRPLEHSEIRWVSPEELPDYPMGKVDRKMAKLLSGA
jgi:mutator protein MutT